MSSPTLPPTLPPIDPDTLLLSPPRSKPTATAASSPFYALFTPRRALSNISSSSRNSRGRTHLPSPGSSPSFRAGKRPFRSSSPVPDIDELALRKRARRVENVQPEPEPELLFPEPRARSKNTTNKRVLMRSLGLFSGGFLGNHCTDWSSETMNFYSGPGDSYQFMSQDGMPVMPFSVKACNRSTVLAFGDESGHIRLVDTAKDEDFSSTFVSLQVHGEQPVFSISWSPDDFQVATSSGDQCIHIFDVQKQTFLYRLAGHSQSVKQVSYNFNNPSLLTSCSRDGSVRLWDTRISGQKLQDISVLKSVITIDNAHTASRRSASKVSVTSATWLNDEQIATACEANALIKVWDTRLIRNPRKVPKPVIQATLPEQHSPSRPWGINALTLSPDRARLYALCRDAQVYTYSTSSLESGPMHAYSHSRVVPSTFYVKQAISSDGRMLATGSADGVVGLFPTDERYFDKSTYDSFVYSAEEKATKEKAQKSLDVGRGAVLVRGHEKEVTDVTWTINGDLVSIGDDYRARCWRNGETGQEAEELREGGEDGGQRWNSGWAER